jgi:hypothetical protein
MWAGEITMKIEDELDPGEQLLWHGQPKQGLLLRSSDILMIPFSLLWGGFAIFWESAAITNGAPFFFVLWGIPFMLVGLYVIVGRFFVEAAQRSRTYYAVTDERIIILSGIMNRNVKTLNLRSLSDINLTLRSDGRGTITFGPAHPMSWWYAGTWWPRSGKYATPGFEMIEDARAVYVQIRQAQKRGLENN